ncbi:ABC transporter permease [Pseudarthrobacter sp. L1SW]|uniref:ABC transporter permease n=1 Tax=Pseudarthrobacter sp. L1SW TaxID=2851598 RepID=UPI001E418408|nr:ABC transporter permease [Pseudarthrobacter sp. L1SW]UEL28573.1 ABC transporter permease [Pseudarthrobacter sp. L1SW]
MSTAALESGRQHNRRHNNVGPGPSFLRVLNSEFIKFRTLLSTLILVGSTVLVMVGFAALNAWGIGQFSEAAKTDPQAAAAFAAQGADLTAGVPTSGIAFAQLIIGSLAVLLMSSEFTTGMARSTFTAVPKRIPAFIAKLLVVTVCAFVVTVVSSFLAYIAATPILDSYGFDIDLGSEHSRRLLWVTGLYVAAVAAIGMSLGTLLRNSAGGIMSLLGLFFVVPIAFQLIPGEFFEEARKYLPENLFERIVAAAPADGALEVWQAATWLGVWVVVPLLAAMIVLKRRDV